MKLKDFQNFMEQKGFKSYKSYTFGVVGDYPVVINIVTNNSNIAMMTYSIEGNNIKDTLKEINKLKIGTVYRATGKADKICVSFSLKKKKLEESFRKATEGVTSVFKQFGIKPATQCPVCKGNNCDSFAFVDTKYEPVHSSCINRMQDQVKEKAINNQLSGSYLTGFIGAILGGMIGTVPSVLSIWYTNTIYAILFALIPLSAYYGYKIFKGKLNSICILFTILVSIVSVYFMEFVLLNIEVIDQTSFTIKESLDITIPLLKDAETWSMMTEDSIECFIFVIVGIIFAWGHIKTSKSIINDSLEINNTVTRNEKFNDEYAVTNEDSELNNSIINGYEEFK